MKKFQASRLVTSLLVVVLCFIAVPVWGQESILEEIVVTALKRETTLQETPIAVTVIGAEDLQNSQIRDIRDLTLLAPSLGIEQFNSPANTEISIRGIGTSPFNPGLEPSVGVFVDGVYRSRAGAAIGDYPVVERIEILRGPQSTIFGKNTPAGVISIITKLPEYERGMDASLVLGNYNSRIFKGTVTGPMSENSAFRFSANVNKRDGYIDNLTQDEDVNNRDRWGLRGQMLFEPNDDLSIRIIGDYSDLDEACCAAPPFRNEPINVFALSLLGAIVLPATPFEREARFDGNLITKQELWGVSAQVDWWTGRANMTSITAYRSSDVSADIDADFLDVALSIINQDLDTYETFTQELRFASDNDGPFNWMFGLYYFNQDLTHDRESTFGAFLRPFVDLASGNAVTTLEQILGAFRGVAPGTYYRPTTGLYSELFKQSDKSFALFANFDYMIDDKWDLSGGLRWATETKEIQTFVVVEDDFAALDLQNIPELAFLGLPVNAFAGLTPFQFFPPFENFSDSITEDNVSGAIRINYAVSDDWSTYLSYNTGWKAGGFSISIGSTASNNSFDAESTASLEFGAKGTLLDGRMRINIAIFDQNVDDFQANTFNGANFDLANAGKISIKGAEVDILYRPSESFALTVAATYLDGVYDSFVGASCPNAALLPDPVTPDLASCDPTNPAFTSTQDLSGQDIEGIPDLVASSTATWYIPIGKYEGFVRAEVRYSAESNLGGDQAPQKLRDAYTLVNASAGIGDPEKGWSLTLWGKNLLDEEYAQGIFDSVGQPGSLSGYPNDPLTYGLTFRYVMN